MRAIWNWFYVHLHGGPWIEMVWLSLSLRSRRLEVLRHVAAWVTCGWNLRTRTSWVPWGCATKSPELFQGWNELLFRAFYDISGWYSEGLCKRCGIVSPPFCIAATKWTFPLASTYSSLDLSMQILFQFLFQSWAPSLFSKNSSSVPLFWKAVGHLSHGKSLVQS
jgi:hypothetical protein